MGKDFLEGDRVYFGIIVVGIDLVNNDGLFVGWEEFLCFGREVDDDELVFDVDGNSYSVFDDEDFCGLC